MAQVIKTDKIGTLSYAAGTISMAPSILTIGGQQYTTTTTLNLTVPTVVVNTLYMVYVVQTAGVVSLVQSTNANSVGPVGFTSWKLVGAYYSNGVTATPAFGAFVNIDGAPQFDFIPYTATVTSLSGTLTNFTLNNIVYRIENGNIFLRGQLVFNGAPGTWQYPRFSCPSHIAMSSIGSSIYYPAVGYTDTGSNIYNGQLFVSGSYIEMESLHGTNGAAIVISQASPFAWAATDAITWNTFPIPIAGWDNSSIKDR